MQVLTEKNTQLSQELEECKAQLEAAQAAIGEAIGTPSDKYVVKCGVCISLTIILQMAPD